MRVYTQEYVAGTCCSDTSLCLSCELTLQWQDVLPMITMLCGTTSSKKMAAIAEGVEERQYNPLGDNAEDIAQTSSISSQTHLLIYMP